MSGNTFGTLFAVTNFGESHGPAIGCVIDGCPPGMALSEADIQGDLDRRRPGTSRHVTQRNEPDTVEILSGVYEGKTTGTPICLLIRNTDQRSKDYSAHRADLPPRPCRLHLLQKYGLRDPRGGGRSSARLTAPMVAAGAVAKKWLKEKYGTTFRGCMAQIGEISHPVRELGPCAQQPVLCPGGRREPPGGLHGQPAQGRATHAARASASRPATCRWAWASPCLTSWTPTLPTP
jgi:chorismate synthase